MISADRLGWEYLFEDVTFVNGSVGWLASGKVYVEEDYPFSEYGCFPLAETVEFTELHRISPTEYENFPLALLDPIELASMQVSLANSLGDLTEWFQENVLAYD